MKIKRIESLVCNARMRNWIFVKVVTDLGVHINEEEVRKHPFEQELLLRHFH